MNSDLPDSKTKKDDAIKEELNQIEVNSNKVPLADSEWNFFSTKGKLPPAWQFNHWLNYEYARSSNKIKKAVARLKKRRINRREVGTYPKNYKGPKFAVYLNNYYPDFPDKPWQNISEIELEERLSEQAGGNLENPFELDILKFHNLSFFNDSLQTGQLSLKSAVWPNPKKQVRIGGKICDHPGELNDERFAIFEINFQYADEKIIKKFGEWFKSRRAFLLRQFENSPLIKKQLVPSAENVPRGQGANLGKIRPRLRQLAAMRLMKYYNNEFIDCVEMTEKSNGEPLFSEDLTSWTRAVKHAYELMGRFEYAWQWSLFPPFILNPKDYVGTIHTKLAVPFSRHGRTSRGRKAIKS